MCQSLVASQIHSLLPSPICFTSQGTLEFPASSDKWLPSKLSVSGFGKEWAGAVEKSGSFSVPSVASGGISSSSHLPSRVPALTGSLHHSSVSHWAASLSGLRSHYFLPGSFQL